MYLEVTTTVREYSPLRAVSTGSPRGAIGMCVDWGNNEWSVDENSTDEAQARLEAGQTARAINRPCRHNIEVVHSIERMFVDHAA